jgi:hypothetical protein
MVSGSLRPLYSLQQSTISRGSSTVVVVHNHSSLNVLEACKSLAQFRCTSSEGESHGPRNAAAALCPSLDPISICFPLLTGE